MHDGRDLCGLEVTGAVARDDHQGNNALAGRKKATMQRYRHPTTVALAVLVLLLAGCATLQPGADPVLVRAEQTLEASFSTIDGLLYLEHNQQAELTAIAPNAHQVAEMLRVKAPPALKAATAAIDTYRAHRTPEAKANLSTWLAVCQELAHQAQVILAAYGGVK